jgi:hypothetical protein
MDLVADTILIDQARLEPNGGIESLKSLAHLADILGAVSGTLIGGYLA